MSLRLAFLFAVLITVFHLDFNSAFVAHTSSRTRFSNNVHMMFGNKATKAAAKVVITVDNKVIECSEPSVNLRKELMTKMIPQYEGELWCTCKHLLSATMRLNEVGTKAYSNGDAYTAKDAFDKAYYIFNIFWALRLKIVDLPKKEEGRVQTIGDIMNQMINCCDE